MLRRNVLIFHAGALGDFILTWPIALALARVHAQSRIFYVVGNDKGRLAERALGVEAKDVEGGWHHLFGDVSHVPDPVRRTLEGTHCVINFVADLDDLWVKNVREISRGAEIITVRTQPDPAAQGKHAVHCMHDQLADNRVLHAAVSQMIRSISEKGAGTTWQGGRTTLIHPGSGSRAKCWPVEKWVELIGEAKNMRVVIGEVENERFTPDEIRSLEAFAPVKRLETAGELLDELTTAGAFVGNDSGPGHLAGIIGVPTISLFGVTDPATWSPIGPRVKVLIGGGMGGITAKDVLKALRTLPKAGA